MFGLMPKDDAFFDFFERAASNLLECAKLVDDFMTNYTELEDRANQIHNLEHNGDHLTREAIEKLNRTFITPFDREEIHELVCRLDDVIDRMDEAVDRMVVYRIKAPTEDAKKLAKVLVKATTTICEMMPLMRTLARQPQVILNKCLEMHAHESEGDRIERHGLAALFNGGHDPVDIIKWKDVYTDLEEATDRCADVANVVESIVLQHS